MVRRFIYLCALAPLFLFAGEFTASVDRAQMDLGESFQLTLTLKDAAAKGIPSLNALKKEFLINSQQQYSNTVITNGQTTTSTYWKFTLISPGEGSWEIPSISIESSDGTLSTAPIQVEVVKGISRAGVSPSELEGVSLATIVSNPKPYKNEPFLYTVKLISQRSLANIQLQKIEIEDAIVEVSGDPKVYDKVEKGMRVDVVEFNYLITPLKPGLLTIPSLALQGGIPISRRGPNGSIFDQAFDPMAIMQGFDRLEPFMLKTEEKSLEVQPAILGFTPWLPARSLKIEEVWDTNQLFQEGEPLTRGFTLIAEGVKASQLPSLQDLQNASASFKVYADAPQTGEEVKLGQLRSWRKEQYTIVPQGSGELTLPAITVTWWDTFSGEKKIATIPARTVNIAPSAITMKKMAQEVQEAPVIAAPVASPQSPILYIIIAGLTALLIGAAVFGFMLYKRISRLTQGPKEIKQKPVLPKKKPLIKVLKAAKKDKKEKLPDLNPT